MNAPTEHPRPMFRLTPLPILRFASALALAGAFPASLSAAAIFRDGQTARSASLGGNDTALSQSPVDALSANPAALSTLRAPTLQGGASLGLAHEEFSNRSNSGATMNDSGVVPLGAFALPLGKFSVGLGFIPDASLRSDWRYNDTPGGADGVTSYGQRTHKSEIMLLRTALGASWQITDQFSLGASLGLLYNRNRLESPYIIQTNPYLAGVKTLLDLETDGWGWNGQFGALWKPMESLQIGLAYTLQSKIVSSGRAFSNADAQLDSLGLVQANPRATFDAEVTNIFPQKASLGAVWKATPKLSVLAQVDWINWSDSFQTLDVRLRNVDNQLYRTLLGGHRNLDDDVPLKWRDQWVWRFGVEYALDDHWTARAGYSYGRNPVPDGTLTPLTAVIMEHTLSAGVGYRTGPWSIDLGYQWAIPNKESVGDSELLAGEYDNSSVEAQVHWITLTAAYEF